MATDVNDIGFAKECRSLADVGRRNIVRKLLMVDILSTSLTPTP